MKEVEDGILTWMIELNRKKKMVMVMVMMMMMKKKHHEEKKKSGIVAMGRESCSSKMLWQVAMYSHTWHVLVTAIFSNIILSSSHIPFLLFMILPIYIV